MSNKNLKFNQNDFLLVRKVLNKKVLNYILDVCNMEEHLNLKQVKSDKPFPFGDKQSVNCFSAYDSSISVSLQLFLLPLFEKITQLTLSPTYTYHRIYYNKSILEPHTDRPSCEYSATVCIKKGNKDWPIFFQLKSKKIVQIEMNEGDVVFYKGCDLLHWRNPYEGDRHIQIFLHYVNNNGKNKFFKDDKLLDNIVSYL